MLLLRPARRTRRAMILTLALAVAGCQRWYHVPVQPGEARVLGGGRSVQVTRADGGVYTLIEARVQGDSLVGRYAGRVPAGYSPRVALALADVRRVEARRVDLARTAGAVVGSAVVVALAALGALVVVVLTHGGFGDF